MPPLENWIAQLFTDPQMLRMGHGQRLADLNLGLGWLYYALGRIVRPTTVVVIGSYRGFAPLIFARALVDNGEGGRLHFIDPGLVDDFWRDPAAVESHFAKYGVDNVTHHRVTTQDFVGTPAYRELPPAGLVFVDGYHTAEQARIDFKAFAPKLAPQGIVLLHDSVWRQSSPMYGPGREYVRTGCDFVAELKAAPSAWQVFDLPFGEGLSLVRRPEAPATCLDPSPPSPPAGARRA
jgi:predicted O-methyltransferase YrrM